MPRARSTEGGRGEGGERGESPAATERERERERARDGRRHLYTHIHTHTHTCARSTPDQPTPAHTGLPNREKERAPDATGLTCVPPGRSRVIAEISRSTIRLPLTATGGRCHTRLSLPLREGVTRMGWLNQSIRLPSGRCSTNPEMSPRPSASSDIECRPTSAMPWLTTSLTHLRLRPTHVCGCVGVWVYGCVGVWVCVCMYRTV